MRHSWWGRATPLVVLVVLLAFLLSPATPRHVLADEVCGGIVDAAIASDAATIAGGELSILPPLPVVRIDPPDGIDFAVVPFEDPSWQLYWLGLTWLIPLAMSGDGADRNLAVDYAGAWQSQTTSTADDVVGWDEGTNLRRLQSLLCVWIRKGDPALLAPIDASIAAAQDPDRYPDQPFPNNHTIMINQAIMTAGKALDREDLIDFALDRLEHDWAEVWQPEWFDREQSSAYLGTNISLWASAANRLHGWGRDETADALDDRLDLARQANALLVEPDDGIAAIGDSHPVEPRPETVERDGPLEIVDERGGWALGRSSWDDDTVHWIVRFGPPRTAHGHYDATSVTWSADGHRVLVGPGFFSYNRNSWHAGWDHTPQAHNTASPPYPR
ncbi:hypothetical protein BH24ACT5_BH24ACT5_02240 [soil metagenome]